MRVQACGCRHEGAGTWAWARGRRYALGGSWTTEGMRNGGTWPIRQRFLNSSATQQNQTVALRFPQSSASLPTEQRFASHTAALRYLHIAAQRGLTELVRACAPPVHVTAVGRLDGDGTARQGALVCRPHPRLDLTVVVIRRCVRLARMRAAERWPSSLEQLAANARCRTTRARLGLAGGSR